MVKFVIWKSYLFIFKKKGENSRCIITDIYVITIHKSRKYNITCVLIHILVKSAQCLIRKEEKIERANKLADTWTKQKQNQNNWNVLNRQFGWSFSFRTAVTTVSKLFVFPIAFQFCCTPVSWSLFYACVSFFAFPYKGKNTRLVFVTWNCNTIHFT